MALNKGERLEAIRDYIDLQADSARIVALLAADAPIFELVLGASVLRVATDKAFDEFFADVQDSP